MLSKRKTVEALDEMAALFPNAQCELLHRNVFQLLIATLLSAQATDVSVNKVTPSLFDRFSTPEAFVAAPLESIMQEIRTIGLYRTKAANIQKCCKMLLEDFGITQEQLAERLGRSRPQISNTLRLLKLPEPVQARVAAGVLTAGHARAVLAAGTPAAMLKLADKIVNEELSVRQAEAAAALITGSAPKPAKAKPSAGGRQGQLNEIAERLGDRLDTRVTISLGQKKGAIVIDFATVGDLNRILAELGDEGFR